MTVNLHIKCLILEGLPINAAQGPAVQAAVEAELTRLLTDHGGAQTLEQGGALAYWRGGALSAAQGDTPASLGEKIGRAVYGGIQP